MMDPPVFIIGTGRCGSTMMSNIVRLHPRLLSLSEFFTPLAGRAFVHGRLDGDGFWRLLTTLSPIAGKMLAKGGPIEELLYRFGADARFRPDDLPPILITALPHLTPDCETLYDELALVLRGRGRAGLDEHYGLLFAWLCRRFARARVAERSGSSLLFVPSMARLFPQARFVHLYRDGRDAAISMQRHPFFRLSVRLARMFEKLGIDPYRPPFIFGSSRLYPWFETMFGRFMPIERWLAEPLPLEAYGAYWSKTIVCGLSLLAAVPPERVLNLRFEDVLIRPRRELVSLAAFMGREYEDPAWLDVASALPRRPTSDWRQLPAEQQESLAASCEPALTILGYR